MKNFIYNYVNCAEYELSIFNIGIVFNYFRVLNHIPLHCCQLYTELQFTLVIKGIRIQVAYAPNFKFCGNIFLYAK